MLKFLKNPLPYVLILNILLHVWKYLSELAAQGRGMGFSSDDAWIHLQFGRNFARHFEFAYTHGIPSAGSTAPLWSLILSIPHFFSENYDFIFIAVTVLTLGLFLAAAVMLYFIVLKMFESHFAAWAAALVFVNEWHMIWAALSGMEIMLFIFLELALMYSVFSAKPRPVLLGILGGLLFLTRPEGVLLFAIGAGIFFFRFKKPAALDSLKKTALSGLVALAIASPALIFYIAVDGSLVPNTFFAKGAFYNVAQFRWTLWDGGPGYIFSFMGDVLKFFGSKHMAFLIPWFIAGVLALLFRAMDEKRFEPWGILVLWWFVFLAAYAWKLPKGFQCGRYIMPATPMFIGISAGVLFTFAEKLKRRDALVIFETLVVGGAMLFLWPDLKNVERPEYIIPYAIVAGLFVLYLAKSVFPDALAKRIPIFRDDLPAASEQKSNKKSKAPEKNAPDTPEKQRKFFIPDDYYGFLRMVLIFAVVAFALKTEWDSSYPSWNGTSEFPSAAALAEHPGEGTPPAKIMETGRNAFIWWVLDINEQHIPIGKYIKENTPPDSIIATHDIGAVAYFGERPVVDVIGLVTPEMISFCHDHDRMRKILEGTDPLSEKIIGPYGGGRKFHADYFALFTQQGAGFYEFFVLDKQRYGGFLTPVKEESFSTPLFSKSVFTLCKINISEAEKK